jgi:hypothetical protein
MLVKYLVNCPVLTFLRLHFAVSKFCSLMALNVEMAEEIAMSEG